MQIILQHVDSFRGQRQQALLPAFAVNADLGVGQLEIFELEIESLPEA